MFKDLHEVDGGLQEFADTAGKESSGYQSSDIELFPAISAYVESLPHGLIADEI